MEFQQTPLSISGMYTSDADLFGRVWERVGAQERADCPIIPTANSLTAHEKREEPMETEAAEVSVEQTEDDFPQPDDLPCLGRASAGHQDQLQQYIREELEGWQLYRYLARKISGPHARTLAALASEKHGRARRLAAAHFLIAGVRYWPTDRLETPHFSSWLGTLRERYSAEQRHQHRYRAAAYDTADPCLAELYSELAEECSIHAATLRRVLEGTL